MATKTDCKWGIRKWQANDVIESPYTLITVVWREWPGMLQSRKSWFEVVIYVFKNLPGTQHNSTRRNEGATQHR